MSPIRSRKVVGVDVAVADYAGVIALFNEMIDDRRKGYFAVAAVHTIMLHRDDPEFREAVDGATLTVPDGMPIVWALRALGEAMDDRVYGPELMARTCADAAGRGTRIYLYGGYDRHVLAELARRLKARFPGIKIVGSHSPPHDPVRDTATQETADRINEAGPDIVWVGIGVPKQEMWMERMRPMLDAPVLVGVGAAFDFHAGRVRQAPPMLQRHGMEWAFRLAMDPRRLAGRYVKYNPRFVAAFARQLITERRRRTRASTHDL